MRRREFITLIGAAAAWPLPARAQQGAKVARIGYLVTASLESPEGRAMADAFRQGLRERGYVEGQSIIIEYRSAHGRIERFPELANELASLNLDLILAPNTPAARAAQHATTTIPIVVPVMGDPIADGLVASLAHPGGNITGLTFLGPELVSKRLGLLKQALPNASRVAALWHSGAYGERTTREMLQATDAAARTLAVELQLVEVRGVDEFNRAFSAMTGNRSDALIVLPSPLLFNERKQIVDLAMKHRLPSISMAREFAELGGLMAYGASLTVVGVPTFKNRENYRGYGPPLLQVPKLRKWIGENLAAELVSMPHAIIVPLGRVADEAIQFLHKEHNQELAYRSLNGFPHPSGANGHRKTDYARGLGQWRAQVIEAGWRAPRTTAGSRHDRRAKPNGGNQYAERN